MGSPSGTLCVFCFIFKPASVKRPTVNPTSNRCMDSRSRLSCWDDKIRWRLSCVGSMEGGDEGEFSLTIPGSFYIALSYCDAPSDISRRRSHPALSVSDETTFPNKCETARGLTHLYVLVLILHMCRRRAGFLSLSSAHIGVRILLGCPGAVLGTVGYLQASLVSTHWMPSSLQL